MIFTIFAPEPLLPLARALSGVFGLTPADYSHSFQSLTWQRDGVLYSCHSCPASERIVQAMQELQSGTLTLTWPEWYTGPIEDPQDPEHEWHDLPAMAMEALATVGQPGGLILGLTDAQQLAAEHGLVPAE